MNLIGRLFLFLAGLLLLSSCSTGSRTGDYLLYGIGGGDVYNNGQRAKAIAEGRAPAQSLRAQCADGRYTWANDSQIMQACFEAHGWHRNPDTSWTRINADQ